MDFGALGAAIKRLFHDPAPAPGAIDHPDGRGGKLLAVEREYELKHVEGVERFTRNHTYYEPVSFARSVKRLFKPDVTEIAVRRFPDGARAVAMDRATRVDGDVIVGSIGHHPVFALWLKAIGAALTQQGFYSLLRATAPNVPASDLLLGQLAQLRAEASTTFTSDLNERGDLVVMGRNERREVRGQFPPEIIVLTPIYRGASVIEQRLELLLNVEISEKGPLFKLTWPAEELVYDAAMRDLSEFLGFELGDGYAVEIGELCRERIGGSSSEMPF